MILHGGFEHHVFDRTPHNLVEAKTMRTSYAKGDAYTVEWNRVHKLDNLADHTLTLVVESPVARHFSEAFYNGSGEPSLFCDFVELHPRLAAEMASL